MKFKECLVIWKPKSRFPEKRVVIQPKGYPIPENWYWMPGADLKDELDPTCRVFVEFNTLVVRDGICPQQAHDEFLKIDEYRATIAPDMRGAE